MDYRERLKISCDGNLSTEFFTKSGIKIAQGYNRIVIGGRGPYIEFEQSQIDFSKFKIPEKEFYRITNNNVFYLEYRTEDNDYVKLYLQKKLVDYADYKIDFCYISPFDIFTENGIIIEKIKKNASIV